MSYIAKFVVAIVGLVVMAIVASRQLFLFAVFRDPQSFLDLQGGRYHLWLALSAAITAGIAASLMFYLFRRHWRNKGLNGPTDPMLRPPLTSIVQTPSTRSPTPVPFDPIRWALANPWLSEGQADDRIPMNGSVADSNGTPSAQRAFARRSHQVMFKKWSQARHDST